MCERIFIKTHNIEIRFVIELENVLSAGVCVCVCVCALFSPEVLQAVAVKGLMRAFFVLLVVIISLVDKLT